MTKEKFIAIMMLYGMPKDEAEKLSRSFIFESRPKVEVVDGEDVELDELSYEVGYTRGQMAERRQIIQVVKDYFEASGLCDEAIIESLERYAEIRGEE